MSIGAHQFLSTSDVDSLAAGIQHLTSVGTETQIAHAQIMQARVATPCMNSPSTRRKHIRDCNYSMGVRELPMHLNGPAC
jgi:hypothetical protein